MFVVFTLNGPIQPMDRGDIFEDPLDEQLAAHGSGEIVGGGTGIRDDGEVNFCDSEVELADESQLPNVVAFLESRGAPKGSYYSVEESDEKHYFGHAEILAVYLNGTDLPDEVYDNNDTQEVYDTINELVEGSGMIMCHWIGPSETALYIFGPSAAVNRGKIQNYVAEHPLCQKSRLVFWNESPAGQ
ncbi:MAG: hypothetical protein CMJ48_10490 [Planctomycetaceae bacterium]|nr:hypothetical protein [Planctomycetaceae bacterium]